MGDARPLDFGHWAAHRLESLSGYALRHGQAVAIGIALDSHYAWRAGLLSRDELDRILDAFVACGLPVWHPLLAERGEGERRNTFPLALPSVPQFRMTRRIEGLATMEPGQHSLRVADSVGLVPDWRRAGEVWEVPFGALVPRGVRGLLVAGRCISSGGDAWQVMRVIPPAAHTGQVAGLAAALAAERGVSPGDLDVPAIQRELRRLGLPLHHEDVGLGARG